MRINTRFPVAIHILALIGINNSMPNTSELMAKSVNTNPVVIRRITSALKKAGLIQVKAGVGGASLLRNPDTVTLLDIYNAIRSSDDVVILDLHQEPNPRCYVGANIHQALRTPFAAAQEAMERELASHTLGEIMRSLLSAMQDSAK